MHQAARAARPNAPRMDVLGKRAIPAISERDGHPIPEDRDLESEALAGDLVANTAYYALVGAGGREHVWTCGLALGLLAGVGALVLPRPMGLGDPPHADNRATQAMTVAWYVLGGLTAAAVFSAAAQE